MLESTLPEQIKPVKLAKKGASFKGKWSLSQFERLKVDALSDQGDVLIDADFSFEERVSVLIGKVTADISQQCQRCLEPVIISLNVDLNVAFVSTEERLASLPESFEGVLLEDDEISVVEVVEEELILALPIVAYHEECDAYEYRTEEEKVEEQVDRSNEENPFDVLAQLKGKLKSSD